MLFNMIRWSIPGVVISLLLLQSCAHNADKAKRMALQAGEEFLQKGRYPDAEIQFRKALQEDPRFGEGYLWLGRAEERQGNDPVAAAAFRQAASRMPGEVAPKVELGHVLLVAYLANPSHPAELYKEISAISEELLARDQNSFDGVRLKAFLATSDTDTSKAVEYFEKANHLRPDQPDVVTALCESLMRAGSKDRAETLARDFLKKQPAHGPLYSMLYDYYSQAGRLQDAEAILRSKVANNPTEGLYRIELARHYIRSGKAAEASHLLDQLLGDQKAFPQARLDVGDFYMEQKDWARARQLYAEGAQNDGKRKVTYLQRVVRADIAMNDRASAQSTLDQILKAQPDDPETQASRAALRMASNDPAQRKLAISEFKALVDRLPQEVNYRYQYAEALRTDGQSEAARQQYLAVVQQQPGNLAALQILADLSIREQRLDEALTYANRILSVRPGDVRASLVRSGALAAERRFVETRSVLTALSKEHADLREVQLQLALLDVEQKHYPEAEARFRKYYTPGKGDVRSLEGLVEVYRAQNRLDQAVALLKQDIEKGPQFNDVRALLARTAAQTGMKELAVSEYEQLARAQPDSGPVALQLGLAYQTNDNLSRAIGEFERAKKLAPQVASVHAFLGKALADAGRKNEAIASFRQSLALDNRNPWVMSKLAFLLAETGDTDAAMKLAQSAVHDLPSDTSLLDTLGFIYMKKKDFSSAIHTFQDVVDKRPKDAGFRTHLGEALLASGDLSKGRLELQTAASLPATASDRSRIQALLRGYGQAK
jgi:Flp pilus assembly protein TadD